MQEQRCVLALLFRQFELSQDRVRRHSRASDFGLKNELRINWTKKRMRAHRNAVRGAGEHGCGGHGGVRHEHAHVVMRGTDICHKRFGRLGRTAR